MPFPITRTEPPCFCDVGGSDASTNQSAGGANIAVGDAAASCELLAAFAAPDNRN